MTGGNRWYEEWQIVMPRTITFEGKEFRRDDFTTQPASQDIACQYYCDRFFGRRRLNGMYIKVVVRPSEPATKDLVMHKLEVLGNSMTEISRRERERTEMLELDGLVNGDTE